VALERKAIARWDLAGRDMEALLAEATAQKGESLWLDARRRLRRNKTAWWSLIFLVAFGLMSLAAPLLPLPSPVALNLQTEPMPPIAPWVDFGNHNYQREYWNLSALDEAGVDLRVAVFGDWQTGSWMGMDSKGRDILSRIIWGSRTSILVALIATFCSLSIGVTYGALSGLLGGRADNLMMRIVDVLYSVPFIFVVIFLITIVNEYRTELEDTWGIGRETVFYLVIGAIYWLTMARVVRGQVLSLKNSEFIEAARVLGASTRRILFVHLVPNVLSIVIVYLTLTIPAVMLFEAFLSFLGLGIEPPKVSWGLLAVDGTEAINPLRIFWWLVLFPAMAMGSTLLALNILGDGLRDALDPKMRGKD
jgi:oligopeptide transport system permease protein